MDGAQSYPLFDSHCHLDVEEFNLDRKEVLTAARQSGMVGMLVPAVSASGWDHLLQCCSSEPDLYPALGLHPCYTDQHRDVDLDRLANLIEQHKLVAIGEIGLDFYMDGFDRGRQEYYFPRQLILARELGLPVILHARKAHDQVIQLLRKYGCRRGIIHAFNGSRQQADAYLALGFKLGFGGTLTYEGATKIRRLARELPLDGMVLETDAPDMTVSSHRGQRNSPAYLPECLLALASIREKDPQEVAQITTRNVCHLLGLELKLP